MVIVTVIDESHHYPTEYLEAVRENRIQYAEKHGNALCVVYFRLRLLTPSVSAGYETFFPKIGSYDLEGAPFSWTKVVAMRHAMTKFPDATYIWFLDQDAFIMNPSLKVEEHLMKPARLEALMIKDHPVVPPDSIIKTFTHLKGKDVDFVLTQDKDGLSVGSFLVRNGEWAEFFLETWFDPIYRTYNFQKAETHALVSTVSLLSMLQTCSKGLALTTCTGAHCPMASDHSIEAVHRPAKHNQLVQQEREGDRIYAG